MPLITISDDMGQATTAAAQSYLNAEIGVNNARVELDAARAAVEAADVAVTNDYAAGNNPSLNIAALRAARSTLKVKRAALKVAFTARQNMFNAFLSVGSANKLPARRLA